MRREVGGVLQNFLQIQRSNSFAINYFGVYTKLSALSYQLIDNKFIFLISGVLEVIGCWREWFCNKNEVSWMKIRIYCFLIKKLINLINYQKFELF